MFKNTQMTCPLMTNKNGNYEVEIIYGFRSPGWKLCGMELLPGIKTLHGLPVKIK